MKIAACAVCKNEEKNIPRWLEHTADFDYRIVVDTGSADNSVQLLKNAGIIVVEKKIEPFRFDEARNAVLEYVPVDADWLVWPDLDEYYNKNWRYEFERAVSSYPWITRLTYKTFQHIGGKMVEGVESGTVMESKIHRNGFYHWEKPVHERLMWTGESGTEAIKHVSGIMRFHMHEPSADRNRLYFEIARRALNENPDDEYLTWFVFKEYYYARKDIKTAREYARRYLALTQGNTDFSAIAKAVVEEDMSTQSPDIGRPEIDRNFTFSNELYTFGAPSSLTPFVGRPIGSKNDSSPKFKDMPNFPREAMRSMVLGLFRNKEDTAGVELARTYLAYAPHDIAIANELAGGLYRLKRFEEALKIAERFARQFPDDNGVMFNLAKCYHALKRPDDASALLKVLVARDPRNRDYALDYALYLSGEGKFDESENILRGLSQDNRVRFNIGWYEMRKGNFLEGFKLRDSGREEHLWGSEHLTDLPKEKRHKEGESLVGKTVLLFNEGGLGDEMIFARFAGVPKKRGAKHVIMGSSPQLVPVFARAFADIVDEVLPMSEAKKRSYDMYIPMMNAPSLLSINTPAVSFPYLVPDQGRVEAWKKKFNAIANGKPKIGIRWAGNPKFEHEQFRTIEPEHFMGLARYGQLFSLQRDWGAELLPHNRGVYDLQHYLADWEETLAVLSNLDLVVSSCTSIVHAAGALGVPTYAVVPIAAYFPWAVPGERSDWYPSVTVFRQEKLRSWKEPLEKVFGFLDKGQKSLGPKAARL